MHAFQEREIERQAYRRPRPQLIEDEDDDDEHDVVVAPAPLVVRPAPVRLARPIALKVVRPIPKKAVEDFYKEAHRQGMAGNEIHAATAIAQDWHRKWTHQDEEGHTMPNTNSDAMIPSHYAYNPIDRHVGAKNPSPEDVDSTEYERKRMRHNYLKSISSISDDSATGSDESDVSPVLKPLAKRPAQEDNNKRFGPPRPPSNYQMPSDNDNQYQGGAPPQSQAPGGLVRPVALRVVRPTLIIPPDNFTGAIPRHIMQNLRTNGNNYNRGLSPLSIPSAIRYGRKSPEDDMDGIISIPTEISHPKPQRSGLIYLPENVREARRGLLHSLAAAGGDVGQGSFDENLEVLSKYFVTLEVDTRPADSLRPTEGLWLTLTKPSFFANLGDNDNGDPMYTLGRMSFDMFSPTNLVCSLQGNFNIVKQVPDEARPAIMTSVPKALQEEVEGAESTLRTYDIVTAFTIEPSVPAYPTAPNKDVRRPIRGLMTTKGYTLPDPEVPNRHSVWITGGKIEPNDDPNDQREWKRQFAMNPPKHSMGEKAKLLAVKMLMGATIPTEVKEDGSLEYEFTRPLGGHGMAYVDLLYVDESLRIVRGHRGTVFVFSKLPDMES